MTGAWEIYVYGDGQFIGSIFNGLKMLSTGGAVEGLAGVCVLAGLLAAVVRPVLSVIGSGPLASSFHGAEPLVAIIRQTFIAAVLAYVLVGPLSPTHTVLIIDQLDNSQTNTIEGVPLVPAYVAHVSSLIGYDIGNVLEQNIMPVDSGSALLFQNGGLAIGAKYLNDVLDITPPSAQIDYNSGYYNTIPINAVLTNYFEVCIFPNLANIPGPSSAQAAGLNALTASTDILGAAAFQNPLFSNPNVSLDFSFNDGTAETCQRAAQDIENYWRMIFDPWLERFNYQNLGSPPTQEGNTIKEVQDILQRYFPGNSLDYQTQLIQLATINAVRSSVLGFDAMNGGGTALQDQLARKETGSGWIQAARLFSKIVLTMRQLFEGLVYGLSAFLPVFFAIAGWPAITTFIKINLWLQLWVPFYVIMNAFADTALYHAVQDVLNAVYYQGNVYGVSFQNVEALRTQANLVLGYIGAFSWSVPTLAWGLVKGGEYAISHGISAATSGTGGQQTAQSVGAQAGGAGNITMGHETFGGTGFMTSTAHTSMGRLLEAGAGATKWQQLAGEFGGAAAATEAVGGAQFVSTMKNVGAGRAYGGDAGKALTTGQTAEQRNIADQETFAAIAAGRGQTVEGFQSAITTMSAGAKAQLVSDWAKMTGQSFREASRSLARVSGDRGFVNTGAWEKSTEGIGGITPRLQAEKTEQTLRTSRMLGFKSALDQNGLSPSAFGLGQGSMEAGRGMGALGEYLNGNISLGDLMLMGKTGVATEAGFAKGLQEMAERLYPGDPDGVEKLSHYRTGWETANEVAKFRQLQSIAGGAGITDKFNAAMSHQGHGVSMALNAEQARSLLGANAQGGTYTFARTDDGIMAYHEGKTGQRFDAVNFRSSLRGREDDYKNLTTSTTGSDRERLNVDKSRYDHRNVDASGTEVTRGNDYRAGNDVIAAIQDRDGSHLSGYRDYFEGHTPTRGGYALVKKMAEELGGFGRINQAVQDIASVSGGVGLDLSKNWLGKTIGIKGNMGYEGQRRAEEAIDANAIRNAMDRYYGNVMAQNKSPEWKMQKMAEMGNDIKQIMDYQATASTVGQLRHGADNPAKGQFRSVAGRSFSGLEQRQEDPKMKQPSDPELGKW
jgi:hypothetical protein